MVTPSDKQRIEEAKQADWKRVSSLESYTPDELSFLEGFTAGAYYEYNFQSERIAALENEIAEIKDKDVFDAIDGIIRMAINSPESARQYLIEAGIIKPQENA